ncbi:MAG: hypothetical protein OER21_16375 [Gemmatimonadota bacterium]|nr:hypothetical protein [Gemmatimonadota bacterium]
MTFERPIVAATILAIGIALAGGFAGHGFVQSRRADRYVTVKGLAERDVLADLALWRLQIVATENVAAFRAATALRVVQ